MNFWAALPIPLFFLLFACVLLAMHARAWRAARDLADPRERDYRRRQFRRRMQTSGLLAMVAIGLLVGQLIPKGTPPTLVVAFWAGIVLLVLWVALLAVADMISTKQYFGRVRAGFMVEQAKLQSRLRRMQAARRNGHSEEDQPGSGDGEDAV